MKEVQIFTDGSCLRNPGPGGYAAILKYQEHELELSKGYSMTTNNRMELMAVIAALSCLTERCAVTLTSDSMYLKNGINSWIHTWKNNGWLTSSKQPVKNADLWCLLDLLCEHHQISWRWVKGHSGHAENERCDTLARNAAKGLNGELLPQDNQW